ncbi:MAG TPA: hypothetical protein VF911_05775 [Thermoanaerobaculia bacterium]|jgi:hypothetical protein
MFPILSCAAALAFIFGPALIVGGYFRSWKLGLVLVPSAYGGSAAGSLVLMLVFDALLDPRGEAAEGVGFLGLGLGIIGGWLAGVILPIWFFLHSRRTAAANAVSSSIAAIDARILAARASSRSAARADPFDYGAYTYAELLDAAAHINRALHPQQAARLDRELATRAEAERDATLSPREPSAP